MFDQNTAARLAFHGFGEPEATPLEGPECRHRLFGRIPLASDFAELRTTTQPVGFSRDGTPRPPRLVVRVWTRNRQGTWWPAKSAGIAVTSKDAAAFAAAVQAAAAALEQDGHAKGEP